MSAPLFWVGPLDGGASVQAWSGVRPPFEPKGPLLDLRSAMREALEHLVAPPRDLLHAVYTSDVREFVDVENVLLYNVGGPSLSPLTVNGLRLERSFEPCPDPPVELSSPPRHHSRYMTRGADGPLLHWWLEDKRATVSDVTVTQVLHDPATWWLAARRACQAMLAEPPPTRFALRLRIRAARRTAPSAFGLVKPLVDGILCSMHAHDGSNVEEIASRLAGRVSAPESELRKLLLDDSTAVLGRRRLVGLTAKGVQWNPADDRCVALELLLDRDEEAEGGVHAEGALHEVLSIDEALRVVRVRPPEDLDLADMEAVGDYAQAIPGYHLYRHLHGSSVGLGEFARRLTDRHRQGGAWVGTVEDLRLVLFMFARQHAHDSSWWDDERIGDVASLFDAIRHLT